MTNKHLKCDNPNCGSVIKADPIIYNEKKRLVYCSDNCAFLGNSYEAFKSNPQKYASRNISV